MVSLHQPLLVIAVLALSVIDLGSAKRQLTPAEEVTLYGEVFVIRYNASTADGNSMQVNVSGQFRNFEVVEAAIEKVRKQQANWCMFAMKVLKKTVITDYWEDGKYRDFARLLDAHDCRGEWDRQKNYLKDGEKEDSKDGKKKRSDWHVDLTLGLAIGFGVISIILLSAVIILCVINCSRSAPPPPPQYPSPPSQDKPTRRNKRRSRRDERSERSSRPSKSDRSRSSAKDGSDLEAAEGSE